MARVALRPRGVLGDSQAMERLLAKPEDHGRLTRQIDHAFLFSSETRGWCGKTAD